MTCPQEPLDDAETIRMLSRLIILRRDYVDRQREFDRAQVQLSEIKAMLASIANEYSALRDIAATELKNRIDSKNV